MKVSGLIFLSVMTIASTGCSLKIVEVGAPAINCKFDTDCTITVNDFVDTFSMPASSGQGRLQSRMFPVGEPGTVGQGLFPYQYRIDLTSVAGLTALPCVHELRIQSGPLEALDYDDDGKKEHVYVVTSGGLGTVRPTKAKRNRGAIVFEFSPAVCAGSSPGGGQTSYFFGVASKNPPRSVTARLRNTLTGDITEVEARSAAD